jgi:hypothetical protein
MNCEYSVFIFGYIWCICKRPSVLYKGLKLQCVILEHGMGVEINNNITTKNTVKGKELFRNMFVTIYIF